MATKELIRAEIARQFQSITGQAPRGGVDVWKTGKGNWRIEIEGNEYKGKFSPNNLTMLEFSSDMSPARYVVEVIKTKKKDKAIGLEVSQSKLVKILTDEIENQFSDHRTSRVGPSWVKGINVITLAEAIIGSFK